MREIYTIFILIFVFGLLAIAPSATAHCHTGFGDCSRSYSSGYEKDYSRERDTFGGVSHYQRGGLAHDYFHTDQFFGREMHGFPDTVFGEDPQYDLNRGYYDKGISSHRYNQRYDSGPYGAYSGLSLRYGEGFVSGEGFGDEYIGDPDQLDERIYLFD